MIIDGSNLILGRLASFAAKNALLGEKIIILNCEHVILTGPRVYLHNTMQERADRGGPFKGPFFQRMPDRFVRRAIRGMLPYKQERGKKAYDRIMCYLGTPLEFKEQKMTEVPGASASKLRTLNYITLKNIAHTFGKTI